MGGELLCLSCGKSHKSLTDHYCFQAGVTEKMGDLKFKEKFYKLCELPFNENMFQNCETYFENKEKLMKYVTNFYDKLFEELNIV